MKKLFVVSDVHGHCSLLKEALKEAGFDHNNADHLLVCCGDYFDRGNENVQVLQFFERLQHKVLLRGNHEDMLLKLLQTGRLLPHHYINGTFSTLKNFFWKVFHRPHQRYHRLFRQDPDRGQSLRVYRRDGGLF